MEIQLEPGDPFEGMDEAEYAEWCRQFERDRELEDAQDYLATIDEMNEEF